MAQSTTQTGHLHRHRHKTPTSHHHPSPRDGPETHQAARLKNKSPTELQRNPTTNKTARARQTHATVPARVAEHHHSTHKQRTGSKQSAPETDLATSATLRKQNFHHPRQIQRLPTHQVQRSNEQTSRQTTHCARDSC